VCRQSRGSAWRLVKAWWDLSGRLERWRDGRAPWESSSAPESWGGGYLRLGLPQLVTQTDLATPVSNPGLSGRQGQALMVRNAPVISERGTGFTGTDCDPLGRSDQHVATCYPLDLIEDVEGVAGVWVELPPMRQKRSALGGRTENERRG